MAVINAELNVQKFTADIGKGYPVRGDKGENAYIHIAYANSADGTTDFTLTPVEGKTYEYLGQCTDNTETSSSEPSAYTWSWLTDEASRQAAETARETAETARAKAEESRASAEKSRGTAESERKEAESARVEAENSRANAESARASAEAVRRENEANRVDMENVRVSAEDARKAAESGRESAFDSAIANAENATNDALEAAKGIAFMTFDIDSDGYLNLNNPYSSFSFEVTDGYLEVVS